MAEVELDAAEEAALHALQAEASTHHGAGQQRRRQALAWLRQRALTDELVANLLVALGLSDG